MQAYETGFAKDGLRGGFALALQAALALKVDLKGVSSWSDLVRLYGPIEPTPQISEWPIVIEQKLNRQFKNPSLLTEALVRVFRYLLARATNVLLAESSLQAQRARFFQRLEWLGDSVHSSTSQRDSPN